MQATRLRLMHLTNSPIVNYYSSFLKKILFNWVDKGDLKLPQSVTREKSAFIFAVLIFISNLGHAQEKKTYYYENGVVSSEGFMRDGKPDGYWKTYYPDGGLKTEGNRKNFRLDSVWKFYRSDSTLERSISYREDLKTGPERTYSIKGILQEEIPFENNIKSGTARYYYPTGELQKELSFVNNKEEGKGFEYDVDGRIITLLTYKNGFIYAQEKINRYNTEGKRTGIWQDLYVPGRIKEEGNWTNGLRNGVFKFYNRKGELERLERYEDGELVKGDNDSAVLDIRKEVYDSGKIKSIGSYKEGKKHGVFREFDEQGNVTNSFVYDQDTRSGEGLLDTLGRKQGVWKWYYPDGSLKSQGAYKDGKRDGPWTYFFSTGKIEQKGNFKEDIFTGDWKWYFPSGSVHREELYRKGKEDGHTVEYDSLGNVITEGDYVDGLRTGKWKLTVNDHTEEGEYADGERTGEWIWKYDNGQEAFKGEFQGGIPIGKHRYWYRNGNLKMRGTYEGGELSGRWEYYDEMGMPTLTMDYEAGIAMKINGQKIKLPKQKGEGD